MAGRLDAAALNKKNGPPPDDFPQFQVPGLEQEMVALRELFWLHCPDAGPQPTMWAEWLPAATLWLAPWSVDITAVRSPARTRSKSRW